MREPGFELWKSHAEKEVISKDFGCLYKLYIHAEDGGSKDFGQSRSPPGSNFYLAKREWWLHVATPGEGETLESEIHPRREIIWVQAKSLRKGSWEPGRFFTTSLPGVTQADFPSATFEGFIGSAKRACHHSATRGHSRAAILGCPLAAVLTKDVVEPMGPSKTPQAVGSEISNF